MSFQEEGRADDKDIAQLQTSPAFFFFECLPSNGACLPLRLTLRVTVCVPLQINPKWVFQEDFPKPREVHGLD